MLPAHGPRDRAVRLLAIDPLDGSLSLGWPADLPALLAPGDLVVMNDAATVPASLMGRTTSGDPIELRLTSGSSITADRTSSFLVVLFGAGDWRTPTEHRPPPPRLAPGDRLWFEASLSAVVEAVDVRSPRLCEVRFEAVGADLWRRIYRAGRPIQYAHLRSPLRLQDAQNPAAGRPVAVEAPSAGRFLHAAALRGLSRAGIRVASLTHAAGLSSTGDPVIDALLPLPEVYDLPEATVAAIDGARQRGGRIVAIGTTVVRALEGNLLEHGALRPGPGVTDLRIGPGYAPRIADALVSGLHARAESHFDVMSAFAPPSLCDEALDVAEREGLQNHEFGDLCIVVPRAPSRARPSLLPASPRLRPIRHGNGAARQIPTGASGVAIPSL